MSPDEAQRVLKGSHRQRGVASQERDVKAWNRDYPEGTPVYVVKDLGEVLETATRSVAWMAGGAHAMVLVDGISGGYILSRVRPRMPMAPPAPPPINDAPPHRKDTWRVAGCECPATSKAKDRCDRHWTRCNARLQWLRAIPAEGAT